MLVIIAAVAILAFAPMWLSLPLSFATALWLATAKADIATTIAHKLYVASSSSTPSNNAFANKTVWITGASAGIGEGLAKEFAKQGAYLILSARRESELRRVRESCANSSRHMTLVLDLGATDTHADAVKAATAFAAQNCPSQQIDILINNAGRSQRGLVEQTLLSVDEAQLHLNTVGTISLTKALLPHWLERKARPEGHIVVVSSIAGKLSSPGSASYSMSKHALHGFFDSLRIEMYKQNVKVTLVCPGPVVSDGANQAITATGGVAVEEGTPASSYDNRRIPTDEFASIMAAAVKYGIKETWISKNPELLYTFLRQYSPTLYNVMSCVFGQSRIKQYKKEGETK